MFFIFLLAVQNTNNPEVLQNMGVIYIERGQYSKAIECFEEALSLKSSSRETLYNLGIAHYLNSSYQAAIQIFMNALKIDSLCIDAHFNLGSIFVKLKDYSNAIKHLERVIEISPGDTSALFFLASIYIVTRKYEQASSLYTHAIALNPSNPRGYEGRATAYWKIGDDKKSRNDIKVAKQLHSGIPIEIVELSITPLLLEKQKTLKEQIERVTPIALEDTITVDPADREVLPYIGEIYITTGDYELAVISYSKLIRLSPNEPRGYEGRASAYQKLGLIEKANRDSGKAKELKKRPRWE